MDTKAQYDQQTWFLVTKYVTVFESLIHIPQTVLSLLLAGLTMFTW